MMVMAKIRGVHHGYITIKVNDDDLEARIELVNDNNKLLGVIDVSLEELHTDVNKLYDGE